MFRTATEHTVRVRDTRPPQAEPAMSNAVDRHARLRVTSRWIEVDGHPAIPVSGELHYSRVPSDRWEEELRLLVATGITLVSTYVFWIHHEPVRGTVDFTGRLDLERFLETAERVGIDVVLRIGPWVHAEVRNGGLPDWLLDSDSIQRTDDAAYLDLVAAWFREIAGQIGRFCGPDGRIVGIQIENELYDQPDHILTLKRLARAAGLSAPLWTATAWGGAVLPRHEVFPLYSGYADGFWAGQGSRWDDSFRDHFTFTNVWDDPGVGGDQREAELEITVRDLDPEFPPATCELGGGMATAYHRRPIARGNDIAAVANVKVGNGSLWQGFYMYAGGINPADDLQESHATGYPNDLPRFDYDFQAAFGATGQPGPSLAGLREHNAFLAAFGERLADMFTSLPDDAPVAIHDLDTLRWAVRSNGRSGFIFLNTHQPHEPLSAIADAQLRISFDDGDLLVPDRPVTIPSGVIARWPLRLDVAGVRIEWATASVIGLVGGDLPTLVLRAHDGIPAQVLFGDDPSGSLGGQPYSLHGPRVLNPGTVLLVGERLRVLVVDDFQAEQLWFLGGELFTSAVPVWLENGTLLARSAASPDTARWNGEVFETVAFTTYSNTSENSLPLQKLRDEKRVPDRYGEYQGRSSAPSDDQFNEVAAVWRIDLPVHDPAEPGDRVEIVLAWEGDVAQLRADGKLINDRFWDGRDWRIDVTHLAPGVHLTVHIAPLSAGSTIDLDATARARVDTAGTLCAVLGAHRVVTARWVSH